jgi:ribosomal protein S12 methylthiotransferase
MLKRIHQWRQVCPEISLRSTFIVGFPGETESEFDELLEFLDEAQLDRVGCFAYSPVEGAAANSLPNPVPEEIKQKRYERFMQTQAQISAAKLRKKIGSTLAVLIDEITPQGAIARSSADAPEIDGVVHLPNVPHLKVGDCIHAKVLDTDQHDLWAQPV